MDVYSRSSPVLMLRGQGLPTGPPQLVTPIACHAPGPKVIEPTEAESKETLDAFIEAVSPKRILEVVRSGALGILCGAKALRA